MQSINEGQNQSEDKAKQPKNQLVAFVPAQNTFMAIITTASLEAEIPSVQGSQAASKS